MAKKKANRVMSRIIDFKTGELLGPQETNRITITFTLANFTRHNLLVAQQNGGVFRLHPESAESKRMNTIYQDKVIITQSIHFPDATIHLWTKDDILSIPTYSLGSRDEDVLCHQREMMLMANAHGDYQDLPFHLRRRGFPYQRYTVTYAVDESEFYHTGRVLVENLGLQFELDKRYLNNPRLELSDFIEPHEDAKQTRNVTFYPSGGDDSKVDFYLQANLIDPEHRVGHVYVNAFGEPRQVRSLMHPSERAPGLYLSSYRINELGGFDLIKEDYITLDKLTPDNGFYRTAVDAESHGNNEHIRLEIERLKVETTRKREALEAIKLENDTLRANNERERIEHEQKLVEIKRVAAQEAEALRQKAALAEAELQDQERQYKQRMLDMQIVLARIKEQAEQRELEQKQIQAEKDRTHRERERAFAEQQMESKERVDRLKHTGATLENTTKILAGLTGLGIFFVKLFGMLKGPAVTSGFRMLVPH